MTWLRFTRKICHCCHNMGPQYLRTKLVLCRLDVYKPPIDIRPLIPLHKEQRSRNLASRLDKLSGAAMVFGTRRLMCRYVFALVRQRHGLQVPVHLNDERPWPFADAHLKVRQELKRTHNPLVLVSLLKTHAPA